MISRRTTLFALAAMAVLPAFETNAAGPGKGSSPGNGGPGKGKSAGKGVGSGAAGKATGKAKGVTNSVAPPAEFNSVPAQAPAPSRTAFYRIRHRNGFQETLMDGRYLMQDNRGRTIVNRVAKPEDYARLRRLSGS